MFDEKNNNLDDLIGNSQQPIIVQGGGSDKKFLYTLLILLVILFIIALGLIAFLGGKYFGSNNETKVAPAVTQQVKTQEPTKSSVTIEKPVVVKKTPVAKVEPVQENTTKSNNSSTDVSELESLVQEVQNEEKKVETKPKTVVEKAITKVASTSSKKGLSQEELAKIAQLVAQELSKTKAVQKANNANSSNSAIASRKKDDALVASLQQAESDTLNDTKVDTSNVKQGGKVSASSNKKVDTFNKVVVEQKSGGDDELSKLSAEIDTILQSEDVQKEKQNLKFKKALDREANLRASELRFIVVRRGDTLSSIANRAYGRASAYTKIYKANPDLVKNPNRIYVGMKLRVPMDEEYKNFNKGN